jgi:hypothetical protein
MSVRFDHCRRDVVYACLLTLLSNFTHDLEYFVSCDLDADAARKVQ